MPAKRRQSSGAAPETLWQRAISAYRQGRYQSTRQLLDRQLAIDPANPDALHLQGLTLHGLGLGERGADLLVRALELRPDDVNFRFNLAEIHAALGRDAQARYHYHQVLLRQPGYADAHLGLADVLARNRELPQAEAAYREALRSLPHDVDCLQGLLSVLLAQRRFGAALSIFERLDELVLRSAQLQFRWAQALAGHGDHAGARSRYELALRIDPDYPGASAALVQCLLELDQLAAAQALCDKLLRSRPQAIWHYYLGVCHERSGRFGHAIAAHRAALSLDPMLGAAHEHLAMISDYRPDAVHRKWLQQCLHSDRGTPVQARIHATFAAARFAERDGQTAEAFALFRRANDQLASNRPFDPPAFRDYVAQLREVFDSEFFERLPASRNRSPTPVFVVGMPRSGSTLVERMLSAHAQVGTAGELPALQRIARDLAHEAAGDGTFPACLREGMPANRWRELAQRYLTELGAGREHSLRVCDKHLGNFLRLGLAAALFPRARFVHVRREPVATCVSCYRQHFEHGLRFTSKLRHLALVYAEYESLMSHWENVLPGRVHSVDYESLVERTESEIRRLIDYLGLSWDPGCLDYHRAGGSVNTASFWQVRRPVYRDALSEWQRYSPWLAPLHTALAEFRSVARTGDGQSAPPGLAPG